MPHHYRRRRGCRHPLALPLYLLTLTVTDVATTEMATDIATLYPEKNVVLVHSRGQLMNRFHQKLHDVVIPHLDRLKVRLSMHLYTGPFT
jgi:hypothetical protein